MKKLFKKIKKKFDRIMFELIIEVLGRSFIYASICFLMQNTHGDKTETIIVIVLLIWAYVPVMRLMDRIFKKRRRY